MPELDSLKVWRAKNNITQKRLSAEVGFSQQHISAIEHGRKSPNFYAELKKKYPKHYKSIRDN